MPGHIWKVEGGSTGWSSLQEELFNMDNAIAPFAGDEMADLLLVYMLFLGGEAVVEVEWAAVTSDIWSPQRAFFVG
jgi:hypothetical protein